MAKAKKRGAKKTKSSSNAPSFEKHKHNVLKIFLIVLVVAILILAVSRYVQEEKEKSFIAGGQNAIDIIVNEVKLKGGVGIKNGDEIIILARYSKTIETPFEIAESSGEETKEEETDTNETTTENSTTQTNETNVTS